MSDARRLGKRVNLTLPADVDRVLARIGDSSGVGKATIIRSWLTDSLPQLEQLARAVELAAAGNIDAFAAMQAAVRAAQAEAGQLQLDVASKRRAAMRRRKKPA